MENRENPKNMAKSESRWNSPDVRQLYTSITALMPVLTVGNLIGYSSSLLQQLAEPGSFITLTPTLSSWIASMVVLPLPPMAFISGYSMERFGRKKTHYIMCFFLTIGWLIVGFAHRLEWLLIGRFLSGIGMGLQGPLTSVYIAETTSPSTRHIYLSSIATLLSLGIFMIHIAGEFLHWKTIAFACCIFSFASGLMIVKLPETPNWYINKGKIEKSEKSFKFYRGCGENTQEELDKMIKNNQIEEIIIQNGTPEQEHIGFYSKLKITLSKVRKREFLLPLTLMSLLFILSQLSGNNAISFYSVQIISDLMVSDVSPYFILLSMDSLRLISCVCSSIMLKWVRKRTTLLFSGLSSAFSLLGLALFVYLQNHEHISNKYYWVSLLFLALYMITVFLGVIPIPWMLQGELFPADLKGIGSSISIFVTCTMMFIVTKTAPSMFDVWGISFTFGFYGINILVLIIIVVIMLPETHGKTLQEIQDQFKRKRDQTRDPNEDGDIGMELIK